MGRSRLQSQICRRHCEITKSALCRKAALQFPMHLFAALTGFSPIAL